MSDFVKELNFDGDTFNDMKRDMNIVLQRLLGNMQEKECQEGTLTLKLDVSLVREYVPNYNPNIPGESREIAKPTCGSDCICGITAICRETFLVRYALSSQCCGSFCQHLESSWMIISGGCFLERRSRIIICSGKRKREEKENDKATDYFKALVGNL